MDDPSGESERRRQSEVARQEMEPWWRTTLTSQQRTAWFQGLEQYGGIPDALADTFPAEYHPQRSTLWAIRVAKEGGFALQLNAALESLIQGELDAVRQRRLDAGLDPLESYDEP